MGSNEMVQAAIVESAFAGQSAVLYLGSRQGRHHEITVLNHADRF
jgi:hypothetical protein